MFAMTLPSLAGAVDGWYDNTAPDPRWWRTTSGRDRRQPDVAHRTVGVTADCAWALWGSSIRPWGADLRLGERPSRWLCGRCVLADQAAEDLMASDPVEWDRERDHMWIVAGCSKVKRAVGPSAVVVGGVLLE